MQTIIETLRAGDSRERLAVVADVLSIIGVSVATVVGGGFALNRTLDVENIVGVSIISLLSLAGASLVLLAFLFFSSKLRNCTESNTTVRILLQFSLWAVFFALLLYAVFFSYYALSHMRLVK
jgi:hypothetical protein